MVLTKVNTTMNLEIWIINKNTYTLHEVKQKLKIDIKV